MYWRMQWSSSSTGRAGGTMRRSVKSMRLPQSSRRRNCRSPPPGAGMVSRCIGSRDSVSPSSSAGADPRRSWTHRSTGRWWVGRWGACMRSAGASHSRPAGGWPTGKAVRGRGARSSSGTSCPITSPTNTKRFPGGWYPPSLLPGKQPERCATCACMETVTWAMSCGTSTGLCSWISTIACRDPPYRTCGCSAREMRGSGNANGLSSWKVTSSFANSTIPSCGWSSPCAPSGC